MFSTTFSNISVRSWWSFVVLMSESRESRENHRPATSHGLALSQNVVSSTPRYGRESNFSGDVYLFHRFVNLTTVGSWLP